MKLYAYALSLLLVGLALITFGAVRSNAQNKPAVTGRLAAEPSGKLNPPIVLTDPPALTDAQKIALLQAEIKVLETQTAQILEENQSLTAEIDSFKKKKKDDFSASRDTFFQQFNDSFKAVGVKSDDYDLDLATLTFKAKTKPEVKK